MAKYIHLTVFFAFFFVMLVVAAATTGVLQKGIIPRLSGVPATAEAQPEERKAATRGDATPQGAAGKATEEKRAEPESRGDEIRELQGKLEKERKVLAAEAERLAELKANVEKLLKAVKAQEGARFKKLARVYEQMKPKEAAEVIERMDRAFAAKFLGLMGERRAAKILEALDSTVAADLSRRLNSPRRGARTKRRRS